MNILKCCSCKSWATSSIIKRAVLAAFAFILLAFASVEGATWTGSGADELASTAANWDPAVAPVNGVDIVLDATSSKNMTWDLDVAPGAWTQTVDYTGIVTIATCFDEPGLTNLFINGNCIVNGGAWTHIANPDTEDMVYRLKVSVAGDFILGPGAVIDVDAKGFYFQRGPGKYQSSCGASYGGRGGMYKITAIPSPCYGSITRPYHLGSGGCGPPYGPEGGGAVWLEVAGLLIVDGEIRACSPDGYQYYSGSGGSICCIAGSLAGSGVLRANGGEVTTAGPGGGGRIALVVTNVAADFSAWSGSVEALGCTKGVASSPGTIYMETGSDVPHQGELIVRGMGVSPSIYGFGTEIGAISPETNVFSRLTLENSGVVVVVHGGSLIDLSGCQIDGSAGGSNIISLADNAAVKLADNPVWTNAILRLQSSASQIIHGGDTLTVGSNGTLCLDQPWEYTGDIVLTNGGRLSHSPNGAEELYGLNLSVNGNLVVATNSAVDVTGCGYKALSGPGKSMTAGYGASHGGHGAGNSVENLGMGAYGSIHTPTNCGSGGSSGPRTGGGMIRLVVSGIIQNDGEITANAPDSDYYTGSGGSIWIRAGQLEGTGPIRANGGAVTGYTPGAGGRIAIAVTNVGETISDYPGVIEATGGGLGSSNRDRIAGAGTVYLLDAGMDWDEGVLIVDNNGMSTTNRWTPIIPDVEGRGFGAVVLREGATLRLAADEQITVNSGWSNVDATLLAEENSEVVLTGGGGVAVNGTSTFYRLSCEVPGMAIEFGVDSLTRIVSNGLFRIIGASGSPVTMQSASPPGTWQLAIDDGAMQDISHVMVANSDATPGELAVALNGQDLGGNLNWQFFSVVPGEVIEWTGAVDGQWSNPGNWDLGRFPVETDDVRIPAGAPNMPALKAATTLYRLEIGAGAGLTLDGHDLTVTNNLNVAGSLTACAAETLTIESDASFAGASVIPARLRLLIAGSSSRTVDFGNADFHIIKITQDAGVLTAAGGVQADEWNIEIPSAAALTCSFTSEQAFSAGRFIVDGNAASKNVTLSSTVPGNKWFLDVGEYSRVTGARVSDSDADAGLPVAAFSSQDEAGNVNWIFDAKAGIWTGGGAEGDFHDPANWLAGEVPDEDTHVLLDTPEEVVLASSAVLRSLTVGGGGTDSVFQADAPLVVCESIILRDQGKLVLNKPVVISNAFLLGAGGMLTHSTNGNAELNKLDISVGGDMFIEQGGVIDVRRKGYAKGEGPGAMTANGYAPSHGGTGKNMGGKLGQRCYGSIIAPTNLSSGSYWDVGSGAVRLRIGGVLNHYGEINADGQGGYGEEILPDYYSGAGGSVWITAADLLGNGYIHANGGNYLIDFPGGGGRISLVVTNAPDFSGFTGLVEAHGGKNVASQSDVPPQSGAGTVFRRTKRQEPGRGTVSLDNDRGFSSTQYCTEIPSASNGDPMEMRHLVFEVADSATLRLMDDCAVGDVQILDTNSRLNLNGYILTIHSKEHEFPLNTVINYGDIIWAPVQGSVLRFF